MICLCTVAADAIRDALRQVEESDKKCLFDWLQELNMVSLVDYSTGNAYGKKLTREEFFAILPFLPRKSQ